MALRQSNLTLCDVNSIASRITTSFDKAIGPSQHKIIARAADNDRLPLAIDDRHYIKLKADLGWSSKQMKEWVSLTSRIYEMQSGRDLPSIFAVRKVS